MQDRGPLRAPETARLGRELLAVREIPRLLLRWPWLRREPRSPGEPVLTVPGFGAGDSSLWPLRRYLRALGYRAEGWGLGRNNGKVPELIPRVVERTARLADQAGGPVRLVGWSLGGNLAREAARVRPELVDRVVTLGTPVVGGPRYTIAAGFYERKGYDLAEIEAYVDELDETPLRVPVTAIYSKSDAIVAWRACIDHRNPTVEHVEIPTSHLGLTLSPDVFRLVARRLAAA